MDVKASVVGCSRYHPNPANVQHSRRCRGISRREWETRKNRRRGTRTKAANMTDCIWFAELPVAWTQVGPERRCGVSNVSRLKKVIYKSSSSGASMRAIMTSKYLLTPLKVKREGWTEKECSSRWTR